MSFSLEGQVALITGASRGIGRAVALELGRLGATVIGTATSESGAVDIDKALSREDVKGRAMHLGKVSFPELVQLLKHSYAFVMPNRPTIWFGNRCTSTHIMTASEVANATPSQSVLRTRAMIFAP